MSEVVGSALEQLIAQVKYLAGVTATWGLGLESANI